MREDQSAGRGAGGESERSKQQNVNSPTHGYQSSLFNSSSSCREPDRREGINKTVNVSKQQNHATKQVYFFFAITDAVSWPFIPGKRKGEFAKSGATMLTALDANAFAWSAASRS